MIFFSVIFLIYYHLFWHTFSSFIETKTITKKKKYFKGKSIKALFLLNFHRKFQTLIWETSHGELFSLAIWCFPFSHQSTVLLSDPHLTECYSRISSHSYLDHIYSAHDKNQQHAWLHGSLCPTANRSSPFLKADDHHFFLLWTSIWKKKRQRKTFYSVIRKYTVFLDS